MELHEALGTFLSRISGWMRRWQPPMQEAAPAQLRTILAVVQSLLVLGKEGDRGPGPRETPVCDRSRQYGREASRRCFLRQKLKDRALCCHTLFA